MKEWNLVGVNITFLAKQCSVKYLEKLLYELDSNMIPNEDEFNRDLDSRQLFKSHLWYLLAT